MLSRKAICLWLLAVSVCLGLAVSAAVLGQQPAAGAATADKPEEPTKASGGLFGGARVATDTAESPGPAQNPPKAPPPPRPYSGRGAYNQYYSPRPANRYEQTEGGAVYSYVYTAKPHVLDPEMDKLLKQDAKMEQEARAFAEQYREAEDQPQRAKVRGNLEELTKEHFDLRQQRRELELSRLEAQLERVRASIKKRNEVKDLIIQRRIAKLLGDEDDLAF